MYNFFSKKTPLHSRPAMPYVWNEPLMSNRIYRPCYTFLVVFHSGLLKMWRSKCLNKYLLCEITPAGSEINVFWNWSVPLEPLLLEKRQWSNKYQCVLAWVFEMLYFFQNSWLYVICYLIRLFGVPSQRRRKPDKIRFAYYLRKQIVL